MNQLIAIDPSIRSCGWAIFRDNKRLVSDTIINTEDFPEACQTIAQTLYYKVGRVGLLVIEMPEFHGTMKGKVSARRGDTLRLACLVGWIAHAIPHQALLLPTPTQWKGQVPKEVTQLRLKRMGYPFKTPDEADAIALGLWAINRDVRA